MLRSDIDVEHTVYLVRDPSLRAQELFTNRRDALAFAETLVGATLTPLKLRTTLDEADLITERRVVVASGQVLADEVDETRVFRDSQDGLGMPDVDVESFVCSLGHWHILGFGSDREGVFRRTQLAIDTAARRLETTRPLGTPSRLDKCALLERRDPLGC